MSGLRDVIASIAVLGLGASLSPAIASAADLAPVGAKGTLTLTVKVEGAGRVNSEGAGWDYYDWSVRNDATLRFNLTAGEPMVDASQFAGMSAGDEEDDSDWEDAWDEKMDACNGDEDCETRVTMQKTQDPHMRGNKNAVMSAMAMMQQGKLDMSPTVQPWNEPVGVVSGTVSIKEQEDTYGIISETGGGKDEQHCTIAGAEALNTKPSGAGDVDSMLLVNIKDSTYELHLLADWSIAAANSCDEGAKHQRPYLGYPPTDKASWGEALLVKGKVTGSGDQIRFDGKKVWQGDLSTAGNEPVTVTIAWSFVPDVKK